MCLIAFAWNVHPDHPLLLVANRDEFHQRPAAPLAWWDDHPQILAGRDLQALGTWLGASRSGRAAAVTNVRGPDLHGVRPRSRGALVADFLASGESAASFSQGLAATAAEYGGFNLLAYDGVHLHYVSNRPGFVSRVVEPGIHALSNAQLDTPWPKVGLARSAMEHWLARDLDDEAALIAAMAAEQRAPDAELPDTGVGIEAERMLSAPFIRTPTYGTRCTTLLRRSRIGEVDVFERRFAQDGKVVEDRRERFRLEFY
ncbi:MAG: NRDE family protein [Panacagrimonas sp.]